MKECSGNKEFRAYLYQEIIEYLNDKFPWKNLNREKMAKQGTSPEETRATFAKVYLLENGDDIKYIFCSLVCFNKTRCPLILSKKRKEEVF